ncbi:transcriptional coactivator/pterin dehydratase [Pseudovirgaria hyperparasitica]|uniref:4a-hydroxytetrahydrobiopterin dehydratase n=1 Tax=Pseudovirgaria hyperparasitica TaxID=470096 RepID=A0A6A6WJ01_9PEZI|nr:transcriptional coactivator/pterin dehydratase [Pseudovirgaria hyperparasitica]KAF2761231.1 transcriptional coactivator/pterin dehydratase [Pseudovirgaria hyperparasitica]
MLATRRCLTPSCFKLPTSRVLSSSFSVPIIHRSSTACLFSSSTASYNVEVSNTTSTNISEYQHQLQSVRVAPTESVDEVRRNLDPLLQQTRYIVWSSHALHRTYRFPTYHRAILFITRIAALAEQSNHHPIIEVTHNRDLSLTWTTNFPKGLSSKDIAMARASEDIAVELETSEHGPKPEGAPHFGPWDGDWTMAPTKLFRPPKKDEWGALRSPKTRKGWPHKP